MATIVLGAIGTLIGGPIGGALGSLLGSAVDKAIFAPGPREGPRLNELKITTSSYGAAIPRHFGRMRVSGQIIWSTDLIEHKEKQGGGKGSPAVTTYSYSASLAVALSSRPLLSIGRIWADGKLLRGAGGDLKVGGRLRFYSGHGDQQPDPLIAAAEGIGQCPAYRGTAYVVFEDLDLSDFGNRIPSLSFEVIADPGTLWLDDLLHGVIPNSKAPLPLDNIAGLSMEGPVAETLATLQPLLPIDVDANGDTIVLSPEAHDDTRIALPPPATSSRRDDFGPSTGFSRQRGGEPVLPVRVLRYYDLDRDYLPGSQRASGQAIAGQPQTIELPASLSAAGALQLIERAARRANWTRQAISWRVAQLDPRVRPGTTVTLPDKPGLWRVRSWEWGEHGVDLSLVRMPLHGGTSSTWADPGRLNRTPDLAIGRTGLAVCELPWDGASPTAPLVLAVASSAEPGWRGASLYLDRGDGALEPLGPTGRKRGVIGTAKTVLPCASPLLFDRSESVDISLIPQDLMLTSASLRQLDMGANRAVLGEEIIQFADAQPLGGGNWRLSGLWRGRGGTENAVGQHHAGEPFILLDGTGTVLDPLTVAGLANAEVAALGIADPDPVTAKIMLKGIGTRPLSPVHGRWDRRDDGSFRLSWTRRARGAWLWLDGVETPLAEQVEGYEITFGTSAEVSARWASDRQELTVPVETMTALLAGNPTGQFFVRQSGNRALSAPLPISQPSLQQ